KVVADPQIIFREMIVETDHPVAGPVKMAGVPIKMSATPGSVDTPAPMLGQHTAEILQELLGLKPEDIEGLRTRKVL
ncbi:MAG: CoA transferase, partial [Sporomusaceae bacterium]|nr:CoA transferase [Sporomusaceae bacterium]